MNLINNKIKFKTKNVTIKKSNEGFIITNKSSNKGYIIFSKINFSKKKKIKLNNIVVTKQGKGCSFKLLNRKFKVVQELENNSEVYLDKHNRILIPSLAVYPNSSVVVKSLDFDYYENNENIISDYFSGDILLISPGYPSDINKYNCAFVHTRVLAYKELGWNVDVAIVNENYIDKTEFYNYEGVSVIRTGYNDLRKVLQNRKYNKILVHFFSDEYAQILDASDLTETNVFLYSHGADFLYRAWDRLNAKYFEKRPEIPEDIVATFDNKDNILKRYSKMENVKIIFVSKWAKELAENLNNIKYNNSEIIPCFIDDKLYSFEKKDASLRKKIFIIRRFDNLNTYSIDINVRVILELSKRPCFNDLEFSIYGDGELHDVLLEPVKNFQNVHIYKKFLTHDEIADVHKNNGIALFASRFDTQAVSACEAAMSGNVVITSKNIGTEEYIDPKIGTYCDTEDYVQYANIIEELYYNEEKFLQLSKKMHESVMKTCSYNHSIKKDIDLIENTKVKIKKKKYPNLIKKPIITIAIPSYNVEKYLKNGVLSLIEHQLADKVEVLIINDGSKDNTAKLGKSLEEMTNSSGNPIVKLIDKENGGHGSTINKGIELAKGKYFKLMDGDDYFITEEFEKLIQILEKEDSDLILTNYIEDFAIDGIKHPVHHYDFMVPGMQYNLDDMAYFGYGFFPWGPLLSTSTYKTEILKNANFKIDENCFYVDMEYNLIGYIYSNTVTYYPLDIYNYYLGRAGQSISRESFKKNCYHHEKVCLRLIDEYEKLKNNISDNKKKYIVERMIIPMCKMQYDITIEYFNDNKRFISYDTKLKKYPYFYNMNSIVSKKTRLHRKTKGYLIKFDSIIKFLIHIIKR